MSQSLISLPLHLLMLASILSSPISAQQTGVIVNFDPSKPSIGPFPSDFLTTPNSSQKTGFSVNLPSPDCTAQPSECAAVSALNQLDGFHLQPRIVVNFSGAVDPATLKAGILFVWLDNLANDEKGLGPSGQITTINEIIYDPATNTAYAKPNDFFDQHRQYALVVTDSVRDTAGKPVKADPSFTACVQSPANDYCNRLKTSLSKIGGGHGNVVAASVFTTMSATAWIEKVRDLLPQVALGFRHAGTVKAAGIVAINYRDQAGSARSFTVPTTSGTLTGVDRIVLGSYQSPNFLNDKQYIPENPTANAVTAASANNTIQFHAYIPSSPMPPGGYPVVIFGHSIDENSFVSPTLIASTFAQAGFVTLAINAVGHGFGPQSVVEIVQQGKFVTSFPGGGRGVDLNGDGQIDNTEGCFIGWPYPVAIRDCLRQTAVDLVQLSNLVRSGVAIDPSSSLKLDANKIYYSGISLGAMYGTILHAIDPNVRAAAPSAGGGSPDDIGRWTLNPNLQQLEYSLVAGRVPSLVNGCAVSTCAGRGFNDNNVLRDQPPKINDVAGAINIQNMFGELDWLQAAGDPLSYAPHLNRTPLANVPAKPVLYLYPFGDLTVPNPQESELIRAAGTSSSSTLYRADLAATAAKSLGEMLPANYDPHVFIVDSYTDRTTTLVAEAMQQEIAGFFNSDGSTVPDPNAAIQQLFPVPLTVTLFQTVVGGVGPISPAIAAVANGASFVPGSIVPGEIATIFGVNLTSSSGINLTSSLPLPTEFLDVSVMVDGSPVPLFAVDSVNGQQQINFQVPWRVSDESIASIAVSANGTTSPALRVPVLAAQPAIFSYSAGGQVFGAVLHANFKPVDPQHPSVAGEVVLIYCTGLGAVSSPPANGGAANGQPTKATPTVTIGGLPAKVSFSGLAPGYVGLYQVNVQVPTGLQAGNQAVVVTIGGASSKSVLVPVQ